MISTTLSTVRPVTDRDLHAIVEIHGSSLDHGFFSRLGSRFLRSYYRGFVRSPWAVALAVELDEVIVGSIVGPTHHAAHARWIVRHRGLRMATTGFFALLWRPRQLLLFVRTRVPRYTRAVVRSLRARDASTDPETPTSTVAATNHVAVLMHVAIAPHARDAGLGRILVNDFVVACRAQHATEIRLITNAADGADSFYDRLGWERISQRPAADGRSVIEWRLVLGD